MIRLVTFDFWGTLVLDSAENLAAQRGLRVQALVRALARAGLPSSDGDAEAVHDRSELVLVSRYWGRYRDLDSRAQVRVVLECAGEGTCERLDGAVLDELVEGYVSPVLAYPPELQPGAAEAVRALAARGVRLGIVSNTGRTPGAVLRRVLEGHGLLKHFETVTYSDEAGVRKPDAEIFRRTLAAAGVAAAESAHIGDNPVEDVTGARGAGMLGIHYAAAGRPPAAHADLVVSDLAALPDQLARLAARLPRS